MSEKQNHSPVKRDITSTPVVQTTRLSQRMKVKIRNKSTPKTRQDKVGFFRAFTDLFQYFLSNLFTEIRGETKEKKTLCRQGSFLRNSMPRKLILHKTLKDSQNTNSRRQITSEELPPM